MSALSFGIAPCGVCMGLNFSEDLFYFFCPSTNFGQKLGLNFDEDLFFFLFLCFFFCSSPNFGQKLGLNFSEDLLVILFCALHLILGKKSD